MIEESMKRLIQIALVCLTGLVLLASCGQDVGETSLSGTAATSVVSRTAAVSTAAASEVTTRTTVTEPTETVTTTVTTTAETTTVTEAPPPEVVIDGPYCSAALLLCDDDGSVKYSKAADEQISLASITKLMTASVALKYLSPETELTVGSEIGLVKPESTMAYIHYGAKIKLKDMIYAMLLPSGNDAAYTVAACTARQLTPGGGLSDTEAVELFVGLMNGMAEELGMDDSHFANPEGWDDYQHYTTLNDLMKLVKYAMSQPEIREAVGTHQQIYYYPDGTYNVWTNTNLFLDPSTGFYDPDCTGIKTGTTAAAGCCLVSAFAKDGKTYLCAVMGCYENLDRFTLTRKLIDAYT